MFQVILEPEQNRPAYTLSQAEQHVAISTEQTTNASLTPTLLGVT